MSFTLYLREGAKWSNGDPLTAEDFTFMYYELQQKGLGTVWSAPSQLTSVTAVDDYTVRWDYSEPFPKSILKMTIHSDWDLYAASTWLNSGTSITTMTLLIWPKKRGMTVGKMP